MQTINVTNNEARLMTLAPALDANGVRIHGGFELSPGANQVPKNVVEHALAAEPSRTWFQRRMLVADNIAPPPRDVRPEPTPDPDAPPPRVAPGTGIQLDEEAANVKGVEYTKGFEEADPTKLSVGQAKSLIQGMNNLDHLREWHLRERRDSILKALERRIHALDDSPSEPVQE